jgi:starvation-inducible DNA-binding protein
MHYGKDSMDQKTDMVVQLVNNIAKNLGNAVLFTFKAQGHHWNVEGNDFTQYHNFFGEIYEDVQESIDPMAENLRKLDVKAPHNLVDFAQLSSLQDSPECKTVQMMLQDLLDANAQFIEDMNQGLELAGKCREHGIADFLGTRIDTHKKWQWMIRSHMKKTVPSYRK